MRALQVVKARVALEKPAQLYTFDDVFMSPSKKESYGSGTADVFSKDLEKLTELVAKRIIALYKRDIMLMDDAEHRRTQWPDEDLVKRIGLRFLRKPLHLLGFPTSSSKVNWSMIVTDNLMPGGSYKKIDSLITNLIYTNKEAEELYKKSRHRDDPRWDDDTADWVARIRNE